MFDAASTLKYSSKYVQIVEVLTVHELAVAMNHVQSTLSVQVAPSSTNREPCAIVISEDHERVTTGGIISAQAEASRTVSVNHFVSVTAHFEIVQVNVTVVFQDQNTGLIIV